MNTIYKIIQILKEGYKEINRVFLNTKRKPFIIPLRELLSNLGTSKYDNLSSLSIISTNCFAGRIMQDLNLRYNSPTAGLYFFYPDYIEFLQNLRYYLTDARIEFVNVSKYKLGNERYIAQNKSYPIGILGGKVEIHFLHYHSEKEAAEKWYRRASRVNFDNLLVIGMDQNLCSEADIKAFDKLQFKNKIMFSSKPTDVPSCVYMEEFRKLQCVGDPYKKGHVFYKYLINYLKTSYLVAKI